MHAHSLFGTYLTIPLHKTVTLTCFFPLWKGHFLIYSYFKYSLQSNNDRIIIFVVI